MGQEESRVVDADTPTQTLEARTIEAIAKYIRDGSAQKIVVMVGAGISTSAGIPDFRSPETGLYANLARLKLPHPEAVFDIAYFRNNPEPFYVLAHELYPGKYRPTITHSFLKLLHEKGLLLKLFTQNIDCLEREAGVPGDKIVEAHGSFAGQSCIECKKPYPEERIREAIASKWVPRCLDLSCNGLVKPDIVFFGQPLPNEFFENRILPSQADLAIVMGTSLSVHPFASLPQLCDERCPRVLINKERVGDLGTRPDDVLLLEDCDSGVRKLTEALGWLEELETLWKKTERDTKPMTPKEQAKKSRDEKLQDEVEKLTKEVEENLRLGQEQHEWLENHLDNKIARKQEEEQAEKETEAHLQPATGPESKILAPARNTEPSKVDAQEHKQEKKEAKPDLQPAATAESKVSAPAADTVPPKTESKEEQQQEKKSTSKLQPATDPEPKSLAPVTDTELPKTVAREDIQEKETKSNPEPATDLESKTLAPVAQTEPQKVDAQEVKQEKETETSLKPVSDPTSKISAPVADIEAPKTDVEKEKQEREITSNPQPATEPESKAPAPAPAPAADTEPLKTDAEEEKQEKEIQSNLQPAAEAESKAPAPVTDSTPAKTDSHPGLGHVFPFMK